MKTTEVAIRAVQHYLYCPHRWGLLEIDKAWAENIYVTKANLLHDRVHDPDNSYTIRGKKVVTSVSVYNDLEEYNLYGITDCLELVKNAKGVVLPGDTDRYKIRIVEYKPTKPKKEEYNQDDLMQVFAQKICVDYIFGGDAEGIIYYADVKKRVKLPLQENFQEYDALLKKVLQEIRWYTEQGIIPEIRKKQKCSGCSMKDLCMPSVKKVKSIQAEIEKAEKESVCENF